MPPLVSFLLPAYKGQHLAKAIESILNQTFTDFELVIVNDCSPDDIDGIVSTFKDSRIRYYCNESNIGGKNLVAQWNRCLDLAKGEWTIMASDDDVYDSRYLEEMVAMTNMYPESKVFHCNIYEINDSGEITNIAMPCAQKESGLVHLYFRQIRGRIHAFQEFMLSTNALRDIGGYPNFSAATSTDLAATINVARETPIVCSDKYLFYWRNNGKNISSNPQTALARIYACEQAFNWCLSYAHSIPTHTELERKILKSFDDDIRNVFENLEKYLVNIMDTSDVRKFLKDYDKSSVFLISRSYIKKNLILRLRNKILPWKS